MPFVILLLTSFAFVQELHVWSLNQTKALASLHLTVGSDSLTAFMKLSQSVQSCLHFWGVHAVTIQPELVVDSPPSAERQTTSGVPESLPTATSSSVNQGGKDGMESACNLRCSTQLCEETCC
jgi:zinc transporter 1